MQLATLRTTIQRDITLFLMPACTNSCHILGIKILIVIIHSNSNSLRLRINKSKYKDLKLMLKSSRDKKLLAWMLKSLSTG